MSDKSIYLEEFSRSQIAAEELHVMEMRKLLQRLHPGAPSTPSASCTSP